MVLINGYFRNQPITGQQRYATEMADRLLQRVDGVREARPGRWASGNRYLEWAELQMRIPRLAKAEPVLSLTSRTPVAARKQVVTIHDLFPLTNPEWFRRNYVTLHRRLIRANLSRADAIVTVSEPVRDAIVSIVGHRVRVVVAPNAPTPRLTRTHGSVPPFDGLANSRYFLSVGSVEPRKNMTRLIEAYLTLPRALRQEAPLVVVGGANPVFRGVISAAGSDDTVRLLGRVSDAELAWLYSAAAAFVTLSLAEGFGIPIVEAAAAGCPAFVLSDIPAYRWLTKGTTPIFVDPLDRDSIAAGLVAAISGHEFGSFSDLAERFSWDQSADVVADLLHEVERATSRS